MVEIAGLLEEFARTTPERLDRQDRESVLDRRGSHEGNGGKSGEPYIRHPVAVATIVARQGLDDTAVAAALLHDAVEDTAVGLDDLVRAPSTPKSSPRSSTVLPSSISPLRHQGGAAGRNDAEDDRGDRPKTSGF